MQDIYFVHDHQESPSTRKSFLEMSGYTVTLMKSGAECLEALGKKKPSLVLMDVLIDGPNGFDVCRQIRAHYPARDLPVILTTDIYRSRIYRDEALAAGAQAYVLRPIKVEELVQQVSEVLARKGAAVPAS